MIELVINIIGGAIILVGLCAALLAIAIAVEDRSYDDKPTNTDTLFRPDTLLRRKKCCNCRHSEISTVFPELACPVLGKHVEPHHFCDEWA